MYNDTVRSLSRKSKVYDPTKKIYGTIVSKRKEYDSLDCGEDGYMGDGIYSRGFSWYEFSVQWDSQSVAIDYDEAGMEDFDKVTRGKIIQEV